SDILAGVETVLTPPERLVRTIRALVKRGLFLTVCAATALAVSGTAQAASQRVEVVAALQAPPLARASTSTLAFTRTERAARLNLRAPSSRAYVRRLESAQDAVAR